MWEYWNEAYMISEQNKSGPLGRDYACRTPGINVFLMGMATPHEVETDLRVVREALGLQKGENEEGEWWCFILAKRSRQVDCRKSRSDQDEEEKVNIVCEGHGQGWRCFMTLDCSTILWRPCKVFQNGSARPFVHISVSSDRLDGLLYGSLYIYAESSNPCNASWFARCEKDPLPR